MSDVHGDVGSYVVHGLSGSERSGFEQHLTRCAACQVEVRELAEAAAELSRLASRTPPAALRPRVIAGVRRQRPLPPPGLPTAPPATTRTPPPPAPFRPRGARLWLVALTLVLAVALGGALAGLTQQHRVQVARAAQEDQLLTAEDVRAHRALLAGGHPVSLVVSKRQDRALLVGAALPALDSDHRYQLWTQDRAGAMAPGPTFGPTGHDRVWLTSGVADAVAVVLTVEPRGGSARPTTGAEVVASF